MRKIVQSRRVRLGISLGAAAACIPLLLGIASCSASGSVASGAHSQGATEGVGASGSHAPTGVSSHIVLLSDVLISGTNEQGVLLIENDSGRSIPAGCTRIEVQLVNSQMPLEVHPTPACPPAMLPVGITRLPFTLNASQTVCAVPSGAVATSSDCKPLPAGSYRTQLYQGLNIPDPPAVTVQVVRHR
jgi:hypothetical protein